jgi:hypothetical protein
MLNNRRGMDVRTSNTPLVADDMSLRSTLSALSAVLTHALPLAASAQPKMGYVDYQRVQLEVEDGKSA